MAQQKVPLAGQDKTPPTERIISSFRQLAVSSTDLNAAAEELCEQISPLDAALRKLNLGVSAWHQIAGREDESGSYWSRDIGYAQLSHKWGIALRRTEGHHEADIHEEEVWLFNDAPRWMQIESVGKIPDLFDDLIKRTEDTTRKLKAKAFEAKELAAALKAAVAGIKAQK